MPSAIKAKTPRRWDSAWQKLPAFFRTLSGQKPSEEDLENLIKLLRER